MSKSLVIGYGNPDREDDGVAWHIVRRLAVRFGRLDASAPTESILDLDVGEPLLSDNAPDLMAELQLMPEIAEKIAAYDKVCFVDAHTGAYANDVNVEHPRAEFQNSPFTHHITPQTCLILTQTAYGRAPEALVVSVKGYKFGFALGLSPQTAQLADEAVETILTWLKES
ncbi:MAG TPA: hydrogenase maturation protease [Anaerolineae bacterium]